MRGYESDDGSDLDTHGFEGITKNIFEFLITLATRLDL
jgi:hypothetical protein